MTICGAAAAAERREQQTYPRSLFVDHNCGPFRGDFILISRLGGKDGP